jgi:hypothetical protein
VSEVETVRKRPITDKRVKAMGDGPERIGTLHEIGHPMAVGRKINAMTGKRKKFTVPFPACLGRFGESADPYRIPRQAGLQFKRDNSRDLVAMAKRKHPAHTKGKESGRIAKEGASRRNTDGNGLRDGAGPDHGIETGKANDGLHLFGRTDQRKFAARSAKSLRGFDEDSQSCRTDVVHTGQIEFDPPMSVMENPIDVLL